MESDSIPLGPIAQLKSPDTERLEMSHKSVHESVNVATIVEQLPLPLLWSQTRSGYA